MFWWQHCQIKQSPIPKNDMFVYIFIKFKARQNFPARWYIALHVWCISSSSDPRPDASGSVEHMWYKLEVTVDPAPISGIILITGHAFLTTTKEIKISNPFTEPASLKVQAISKWHCLFLLLQFLYHCFVKSSSCLWPQVSFDGECLSGPEELEVEANGEVLYPIIYSPITVGIFRGRYVFSSLCQLAIAGRPSTLS